MCGVWSILTTDQLRLVPTPPRTGSSRPCPILAGLLSRQVDRNRGSGSQARPDDRIKLTDQEVRYPLDMAFRNGCPSCSEHAENGANHQIRVAADSPEVLTDIAIADQKGPLWISIMIDQIDTVYRPADVASLYQWKAGKLDERSIAPPPTRWQTKSTGPTSPSASAPAGAVHFIRLERGGSCGHRHPVVFRK
jgi:hypothetical protein